MSQCDLNRLDQLARNIDVENLHNACNEIQELRSEIVLLQALVDLLQAALTETLDVIEGKPVRGRVLPPGRIDGHRKLTGKP